MKKFEFKLKKLLRVRKLQEEQALNVFSEKRKIYENELKKKEILLSKLIDLLERNKSSNFSSVEECKIQDSYILGVKQKIKKISLFLTDLESKMELDLKNFFSFKKKRKVLEKLKEKNYLIFCDKNIKEKTKNLDDLILSKSFREKLN